MAPKRPVTVIPYVGNKSMHLKHLQWLLPAKFDEYREPFVGGGTIFLNYKRLYPDRKYWINDLNENLICFWRTLQSNAEAFSDKLLKLRSDHSTQATRRQLRGFAEEIYYSNQGTDFQKAIAYFIMQCSSYGGVEGSVCVDSMFGKNFKEKRIESFKEVGRLIQNVKITCGDYKRLLSEPGGQVFIFMDPPYVVKGASCFYGKKGILHSSFDHGLYYKAVRRCSHKWLITYDNSKEHIAAFSAHTIVRVERYSYLTHGKSAEIIVDNYRQIFDAA